MDTCCDALITGKYPFLKRWCAYARLGEEDISRPQPTPLLRREFAVHAGVLKARLYVTALGVYEAQLNGVTIGDAVLNPGWTSYEHRLCYQTFDSNCIFMPRVAMVSA